MSFEQLYWATKIFHSQYPHFLLVTEWKYKREYLCVYIQDLPNLVQDYKNRDSYPYKNDPRITIVDPISSVRLASICEAATNCLYSMAEISAEFGNKVSGSKFPVSFNDFRQKLEAGKYGNDLLCQLGDLQWYKKVREIRTEWVHYSSTSISEEGTETMMTVRAHRRSSDKEELPSEIRINVPELITWIKGAIRTIDAFGDYLLEKYIIPNFALDEQVFIPKVDENGVLIFLTDRLDMEQMTVREYLRRCGMTIT